MSSVNSPAVLGMRWDPWDQSLSGKYPITWFDNSDLFNNREIVRASRQNHTSDTLLSKPTFLFPDLAPRSYSPLLWSWFPTIGWRRVCERYRSCIFLVRCLFLAMRLPSVMLNRMTIKPMPVRCSLQLFPFMKVLELQDSIWRQAQIYSVGTRKFVLNKGVESSEQSVGYIYNLSLLENWCWQS